MDRSYTARDRQAPVARLGVASVQSARPRDVTALILVVGILAVLFVVSLTLGHSTIR